MGKSIYFEPRHNTVMQEYYLCLILAQACSDHAKNVKSLCNHNKFLLSKANLGYEGKDYYIHKAAELCPMLVSYGIDDSLETCNECRYVAYFQTKFGQISFHRVRPTNDRNGKWKGKVGSSRAICHRLLNSLY